MAAAIVDLEKRIRSALTHRISSSKLAALIAETEDAISAADETATEERARALDIVAATDAAKARETMQAAEFARERLRTVLPRLDARLQQVEAEEYAASWEPEFQRVQALRDELAREYAAKYPALMAELIDLFRRAEAIDKEVSRVNGSAPYGEHRRLLEVELTARGLKEFTRDNPPIAPAVQLPEFEFSGRMAWPVPTTPWAAQFAASMVRSHHPGVHWAAAVESRAVARREETARVAAFYQGEAKRHEERENAEVRAKRKRPIGAT